MQPIVKKCHNSKKYGFDSVRVQDAEPGMLVIGWLKLLGKRVTFSCFIVSVEEINNRRRVITIEQRSKYAPSLNNYYLDYDYDQFILMRDMKIFVL